jgi:hypothetical protein
MCSSIAGVPAAQGGGHQGVLLDGVGLNVGHRGGLGAALLEDAASCREARIAATVLR